MAAPKLERAEIFSKIFLGFSGLCLSVVLALGECSDRSFEQRSKNDEALRLREESYAREFHTYYKMARESGSNSEMARADLDLAGVIAQTLNTEFRKPFYHEAVLSLRARYDAEVRPRSIPPGSFQANESRPDSASTQNMDEWFAVLASYPTTPQGRAAAVAFAESLRPSLGCAEVWQTQISRSYAVVLGGKLDRAAALAAAQRARRNRNQDAFTQVNRQWARVEPCN